MSVKVSVVVAVYNPGQNIDRLIDSLASQTMPADEFEVHFVDDGSTDGTADRLRAVASRHETWHVTTIPNSGWPGRPRNIGMDLARGEYVFFADHDDEFLPEALERMYAMARANGSDIVYPKLVRAGRPTPYWSLARRSLPVADPLGEVLTSRTVHKLYRREFLKARGARFPEGKVRLEDHIFSSRVLPHAQVISVMADYPCYRWIHRTDGSNNSDAATDLDVYWGFYSQAVEVMEREAGAGPMLDRARVVAMTQAFSRLSPAGYLSRSDADRQRLFDAVHRFVVAQFPVELDAQLPALKRLRVKSLRAGNREQFESWQRQRTEFSFRVDLVAANWQGERIRLDLETTLKDRSGEWFQLEQSDGDIMLPPAEGTSPVDPSERVLLQEELGQVEVTVRHRQSGVEWPVISSSELTPVPTHTGVGLRVRTRAEVDPANGFFGTPLQDGTWSVLARVQFLGEYLPTAVTVSPDAALPPAAHPVAGRQASLVRNSRGKLVLQWPSSVTQASKTTARPSVSRAEWRGRTLCLDLNLPEGSAYQWLRFGLRGQEEPQSLPIDQGRVEVLVEGTKPGDIVDFSVHAGTADSPTGSRRLMFGTARISDNGPSLRAYETKNGSFSVKHDRAKHDRGAHTAPRSGVKSSVKARLGRISRVARDQFGRS